MDKLKIEDFCGTHSIGAETYARIWRNNTPNVCEGESYASQMQKCKSVAARWAGWFHTKADDTDPRLAVARQFQMACAEAQFAEAQGADATALWEKNRLLGEALDALNAARYPEVYGTRSAIPA